MAAATVSGEVVRVALCLELDGCPLEVTLRDGASYAIHQGAGISTDGYPDTLVSLLTWLADDPRNVLVALSVDELNRITKAEFTHGSSKQGR